MVSGASEGIDSRCPVLCFFVIWRSWNITSSLSKRAELSEGRRANLQKKNGGGNLSTRRALLKSATAGDTTGRERCG